MRNGFKVRSEAMIKKLKTRPRRWAGTIDERQKERSL